MRSIVNILLLEGKMPFNSEAALWVSHINSLKGDGRVF